MKSRLDHLDVSKGILIILVVAAHIFQRSYLCKFAYNFHMEAFFIISGLLICHTASHKKAWSAILRSKITTLLIPFFFFEMWGILRDLVIYGFQQNWKGFLYNTLTLNFNNGVLWFLFVLFFAELLFILLLKLVRPQWVVMLLSVGTLFASLLIPADSNYLNYAMTILKTLFFLSVGFFCKDILLKTNLAAVLLCGVVLAVLVIKIGFIDYHAATVRNLPFFLAGSLCGSYLVIQAGKLPGLRWLRLIGRETLIIYGTHSFYYVVFGKHIGIADFQTTPLLLGLADFALVTLAEIPTVYLLNRFLPFLVGKRAKLNYKSVQTSTNPT